MCETITNDKDRASGVLLHVTSLPSAFGIGDMGPAAYRFVDFLHEAGQSLWQILPLNPVDGIYQCSPYSSPSAFAANALLISPELLVEDGLLDPLDMQDKPDFPPGRVDYEKVRLCKDALFSRAYGRFKAGGALAREFRGFLDENRRWLDDYALFVVIKASLQGASWAQWPPALKRREAPAMERVRRRFEGQWDYVRFLQFIFYRQWRRLRDHCRQRGVRIIGDVPIYVSFDSVDVWENPGNFNLDRDGYPLAVAGVPPDYFSETGQRWGNPLYDWERLKASRYGWWVDRVRHNLKCCDLLRIDHFRGLVQFWEIPAGEKTAVRGRWMPVPTKDFFSVLKEHFHPLPLIAEDLGIITDDVREAMRGLGLPGMKILLFAFGGDLRGHPYLPHNYDTNCVVYTGTHDNNTVRGWFEGEAGVKEKENLAAYLGKAASVSDVHWALIEMGMMSRADIAIFPMQDVLGLGGEARMNTPATQRGNWQWRLVPSRADEAAGHRLRDLTVRSRRGGNDRPCRREG